MTSRASPPAEIQNSGGCFEKSDDILIMRGKKNTPAFLLKNVLNFCTKEAEAGKAKVGGGRRDIEPHRRLIHVTNDLIGRGLTEQPLGIRQKFLGEFWCVVCLCGWYLWKKIAAPAH